MKLKFNSTILFASILVAALFMTGCEPHEKWDRTWANHPDPTNSPTDTFWAASHHSFLVIPTITIIIVDQKGTPVTTAGITVTGTFGAGNVVKNLTSPQGTATLQILGITYPLVVTASDGTHKFSTVTLQDFSGISSKITITEMAE